MAYRWKVPEFNAGFVDPDGVRNTMMRKAYIDRAANEMNGYATSWPEDIRQIPIQSQSASNSMLGYQPNGAGGFVNDRSNDAMWEDYRNQVGQERREMAEAEMNRQNTLNKITELQAELAQVDAQIAEIEKTLPKGVSDAEWEIAAKRAEIGDNSAYDNLVSRGYSQMETARANDTNIANEIYNAEKLSWGLNAKSDEDRLMAANAIDVSLRKAEDMARKTGTQLPPNYYTLKAKLDEYNRGSSSSNGKNARVFDNTFYTKAQSGTLHDSDIAEAEKYLAENPNSDDASKVKDFITAYRYKTVEAKERYKENKQKAEKIYKKLSSASKDDAKKIWTNLSSKDAKIFKQFYNVSDSSGTISFTRK